MYSCARIYSQKGTILMKKLLAALIEQLANQALSLQELNDRVSALEETVKRSDLSSDFDLQRDEIKRKNRAASSKLSELQGLLSQIQD
jgi:hypothetical protein